MELQHCAAKGKAPTSQKFVIEAIESSVLSKGRTQTTDTSEVGEPFCHLLVSCYKENRKFHAAVKNNRNLRKSGCLTFLSFTKYFL